MTIILVVVLFVLMIFPHELGHFVAAKACGVQVNEFAFGMGPAIFSRQGKETLYSIRLIPLGGYCAMEGEDEKSESDNERAFNNKSWWQKIIILAAGAFMNIVIAAVLLSVVAGISGTPTATVGNVQKDMPAYEAGLRAGDEVVCINGKSVKTWQDIIKELNSEDAGKSIEITVSRDGKNMECTVVPQFNEEQQRYLVGIESKLDHNPLLAVKNGCVMTKEMTGAIFDALKQLFASRDFAENVSGPVGIVSMVSDTSTYGIMYFMYLVALISINVALFNLLPFPALDGGRILFVFIRLITGKAITDEMEGKVHALGMALLLGLFVFATWNDIVRLLK